MDLENVQPSPGDVEAWLGDAGQAWVFCGPNQLKRKADFERHSPLSTLIPILRTGSNALDFHLVFYLGYLAAKQPVGRFVVLAKDTGDDLPLAHASPRSLLALERHIQTKFGWASDPHKVQPMIDRLRTSDVIHSANAKFEYGPSESGTGEGARMLCVSPLGASVEQRIGRRTPRGAVRLASRRCSGGWSGSA